MKLLVLSSLAIFLLVLVLVSYLSMKKIKHSQNLRNLRKGGDLHIHLAGAIHTGRRDLQIWPDDPHPADTFFNEIWPTLNELTRDLMVMGEGLKRVAEDGITNRLLYLEITQNFTDLVNNHTTLDDVANYFRCIVAAYADQIVIRFLSFVNRNTRVTEEAFMLVQMYPDLYVGVSVAGREWNTNCLQDLTRIRKRYPWVKMSIHAGESSHPNSHILESIYAGAARIGHGTNWSDELLDVAQNVQNVLVEINLTSNNLLGYATPERHPLRKMLDAGLPVCLCTDNGGIFHTDMTREYERAIRDHNVTIAELVWMGRNSLVYSFLDEGTKAKLLQQYDRDTQHVV
jgi:adenosine deaminase CECR1